MFKQLQENFTIESFVLFLNSESNEENNLLDKATVPVSFSNKTRKQTLLLNLHDDLKRNVFYIRKRTKQRKRGREF